MLTVAIRALLERTVTFTLNIAHPTSVDTSLEPGKSSPSTFQVLARYSYTDAQTLCINIEGKVSIVGKSWIGYYLYLSAW